MGDVTWVFGLVEVEDGFVQFELEIWLWWCLVLFGEVLDVDWFQRMGMLEGRAEQDTVLSGQGTAWRLLNKLIAALDCGLLCVAGTVMVRTARTWVSSFGTARIWNE